jgi:cell division protein FtsB
MQDKLKPYFNRKNIVTTGIFIMFFYIGIATIGVIARNYKLQQQVDELSAQNQLLALRNQELEYQIIYFQTDAFLDKEARDKLGLKAPGEKVVIFPDRIPNNKLEVAETEVAVTERSLRQKAKDNFNQWLFFLFHKEPTG